MNLSTRFSVSVHILCVLYYNKDIDCNSELIAGSVNTNPVVIRRLVSSLKKAGLVKTTRGVGRIELAKDLKDISLCDVYQAVDNVNAPLFGLHENVNPNCPVGRNINSVLREKMDDMQRIMIEQMADIPVSEIMSDIYQGIENEKKSVKETESSISRHMEKKRNQTDSNPEE